MNEGKEDGRKTGMTERLDGGADDADKRTMQI